MNATINNVNLEMTSLCDRACPDCCCATNGKLFRKGQHYDWAYFERAAKVLYGIERVLLCGGEPTFHPQFAEFVPKFKELFGCKTLAMVTDGWGYEKYRDVMKHIDHMDFTDYHTRPFLAAELRHFAEGRPDLISIFDAGKRMENFTPRSRVGSGNPCERAWWRSGTIAYADGKVYGCCVAPGIEGAVGLTPKWEAWIGGVEFPALTEIPPVPCGTCFFSE